MSNEKRSAVVTAACAINDAISAWVRKSYNDKTVDDEILALVDIIKPNIRALVHATGSAENEEYDVEELIKQLPAGQMLMRYENDKYAIAEFKRDFGINYTIMPITALETDPRIVVILHLATLKTKQ